MSDKPFKTPILVWMTGFVLLAICGTTCIGIRSYLRAKAIAEARRAKLEAEAEARRAKLEAEKAYRPIQVRLDKCSADLLRIEKLKKDFNDRLEEVSSSVRLKFPSECSWKQVVEIKDWHRYSEQEVQEIEDEIRCEFERLNDVGKRLDEMLANEKLRAEQERSLRDWAKRELEGADDYAVRSSVMSAFDTTDDFESVSNKIVALLEEDRRRKQQTEERLRLQEESLANERSNRMQYAAKAISALDLKATAYLTVQKYIYKDVQSVVVGGNGFDGIDLDRLRALQEKKDWLGFLNEIQYRRMEELPPIDEIDRMIASLKSHEFLINISFRKRPPAIAAVRLVVENQRILFEEIVVAKISDRGIKIPFAIEQGKIYLVEAEALPQFIKRLSDGMAQRLFQGVNGMHSYFIKILAADRSYAPTPQMLEALERVERRESARRKKEIHDKYWKSFKR